jgi:hypothetical protein
MSTENVEESGIGRSRDSCRAQGPMRHPFDWEPREVHFEPLTAEYWSVA